MHNSGKKIICAFLILLAIGALFTRFWDLNKDPLYISWSKGMLTDPGFYLSSSREMALFGKTGPGDWNTFHLFPFFALFFSAVFKLIGVSLFAANLTNAFLGTLSSVIFYFILKKIFAARAAFTGFILSLINFPLIAAFRTSIVENLCLFLFLAAVYFYIHNKLKPVCLLSFFLIFTKFNFIIVPAAFFLTYLFSKKYKKAFSIVVVTALSMIILAYIIFIVRPPIAAYTILDKMTRYSQSASAFYYIFNTFYTNMFFRMPFVFTAAFLFLFITPFIRKLNKLDKMFLWLLFLWAAQISFIRYNPFRFQLITVYPLIYFALRFLYVKFYSLTGLALKKIAVNYFFAYIFSFNFIYVFYRSFLKTPRSFEFYVEKSFYLAAAVFFIFYILSFFKIKTARYNFKTALCVILLSALVSFFQFYNYYSKSGYFLYDSANFLKTLNNEFITGGWYAPVLSLNTNHKTYVTFGLKGEDIKNHNIKYLILQLSGNNKPIAGFHKKYNLKFLKSFENKTTRVKLGFFEVID